VRLRLLLDMAADVVAARKADKLRRRMVPGLIAQVGR